MAVFSGLALVAVAIYFGPGSQSAMAQSGGMQKIAICDEVGSCADVKGFKNALVVQIEN